MQILFKLQPRIALDVFFKKQNAEGALNVDDFDDPSDRRKNPLDEIPRADILSWCDESPTERAPMISQGLLDTNQNGEDQALVARLA